MLNFKNCQVTVSGSPILANNASISEEASLEPIGIFGYSRPATTSPNAPKRNKIQIQYRVETNNEPNFYLAKAIREYNTEVFPIKIVIGGITGDGYLSSYSMDILPNNLVVASVSYDVFSDLTGILSQQPANILAGYNVQNGSGMAHYWTTYAKTIDGTTTGSLIQGTYSFNANWQPIYKIGSATPSQVNLQSAEENYAFLSEYNLKIVDSGQPFEEIFTDIEMIEFNNQSSEWSNNNTSSLKLYPASGKIIGQRINFGNGTPILSTTNIVKFY